MKKLKYSNVFLYFSSKIPREKIKKDHLKFCDLFPLFYALFII